MRQLLLETVDDVAISLVADVLQDLAFVGSRALDGHGNFIELHVKTAVAAVAGVAVGIDRLVATFGAAAPSQRVKFIFGRLSSRLS